MKTIQVKNIALAAVAALALAVSSNIARAASDIVVGPSGTETGLQNPDCDWQHMWGGVSSYTLSWDALTPPPTGDTQGSVYSQGTWSGGAADNYNIGSPGNWWGAVTFDAGNYTSIEMDIKFDTTSTMTPLTGGSRHVGIGFDHGYAFDQVTNVTFNTGDPLADGNWHHLSIGINAANLVDPTGEHSVSFYEWNASASGTMGFWVANVVVKARVVPVAPPTLSPPTSNVTPGLNEFEGTEGNSYYDRQEACLVVSNGLSWVGNTVNGPVTYSFTINGFPQAPATEYGCAAYLMMASNPSYYDASIDWNEPNCIVISLEQGAGSTIMNFSWKTNDPNAATGNVLGTVTNIANGGTALGGWSVQFTSDTTVTMYAPDGNHATYSLDPGVAAMFQEHGVVGTSPGMFVYLGMQANNAASMNQPVTYSKFSITGVPSAMSDTFTNDPNLNTNVWYNFMAGDPSAVVVFPSDAEWVTWTKPSSRFELETASSLPSGPWTLQTAGPVVSLYGEYGQFIANSALPAGNTCFFRLVQLQFSQLQVLMPGENNAPNTPSGKGGTPSTITSGTIYYVTVNACDANWNVVTSTDTVEISSTDNLADLPNDTAMAGGTVSLPFEFGTTGPQSLTAADTTNPLTILPNTGTTVDVQ